MANLFIVATPIGNLKDVSKRALEVLKGADFVLAEDTRVTKKLLYHYGISTPVLSYHQHSRFKKIDYILKLLDEGKNLALVSDAGTPGISDPGGKLIERVIEFFGDKVNPVRKELDLYSSQPFQGVSLSNGVNIVPIPGPSALAAAASISGFNMDSFLFLGFPPAKKKRRKFFEKVVNSEYPVIFYESPHRILKTLEELRSPSLPSPQRASRNQELRVIICKELTKKFEKVYRGTIEEVIAEIKKNPVKGEYVVVLSRKG